MSSSLFLFRKVKTMDKDKELKKESKAKPEVKGPEPTSEVKPLDENLEATQKEIQDEKALKINIPGATKLDIDFELANVVFFKVNKPLGDAAYNLIESRVDAINQKYSDKITIILVPFSVNVEQE